MEQGQQTHDVQKLPTTEEVTGKIAIQCDTTHTSRLAEYLSESYPCKILKQSQGLVFVECDIPAEFLKEVFKHNTLYRYVHRYYLYQHELQHFDFSVVAKEAKDKVLRVQVYPKSKEQQIINQIPLEVALHPKDFTHYLSTICLDESYYVGLAPRHLFFSSEYAIHHVEKNAVSRALYKIKEVIERMNIKLDKTTKVIDVGAAPGGWTMYLSKYVGEVIAIDPAELKIQLLPNTKHLKMKAEDALPQLTEDYFDLVVCDINHDGKILFDVLHKLHRLLKKGGFLIITIKMPKRTPKNIEGRLENHKKEFLQKFTDFVVVRTFWLLANSYERCLVAQRVNKV